MSDLQRKLLKALIVGKPNVGKSTLLNFLVGEKVSIVSRKAQTTQRNTTGVITKNESQLIFFDTPGLNKVEKNIKISETFKAVAESIDVLIYMVDNRKKSQSIDNQFSSWLNNNEDRFRKKILVVNKIDSIEKIKLLELTKEINEVIYFDETWGLVECNGIKLAFVIPNQHPAHVAFTLNNLEYTHYKSLGKIFKKHRDGSESFYDKDCQGNTLEFLFWPKKRG